MEKKVPDDIESYHLCISCRDDGILPMSKSQCFDLHIADDANPPLDILFNTTEILENDRPHELGLLTVINAITGRSVEPAGLEVSFLSFDRSVYLSFIFTANFYAFIHIVVICHFLFTAIHLFNRE